MLNCLAKSQTICKVKEIWMFITKHSTRLAQVLRAAEDIRKFLMWVKSKPNFKISSVHLNGIQLTAR